MNFSRNTPCAQCGASVVRTSTDEHVCDPRRRVEFQVLAMTAAISSFDNDLQVWLAGREGRFESYLAARDVRRGRLTGS